MARHFADEFAHHSVADDGKAGRSFESTLGATKFIETENSKNCRAALDACCAHWNLVPKTPGHVRNPSQRVVFHCSLFAHQEFL